MFQKTDNSGKAKGIGRGRTARRTSALVLAALLLTALFAPGSAFGTNARADWSVIAREYADIENGARLSDGGILLYYPVHDLYNGVELSRRGLLSLAEEAKAFDPVLVALELPFESDAAKTSFLEKYEYGWKLVDTVRAQPADGTPNDSAAYLVTDGAGVFEFIFINRSGDAFSVHIDSYNSAKTIIATVAKYEEITENAQTESARTPEKEAREATTAEPENSQTPDASDEAPDNEDTEIPASETSISPEYPATPEEVAKPEPEDISDQDISAVREEPDDAAPEESDEQPEASALPAYSVARELSGYDVMTGTKSGGYAPVSPASFVRGSILAVPLLARGGEILTARLTEMGVPIDIDGDGYAGSDGINTDNSEIAETAYSEVDPSGFTSLPVTTYPDNIDSVTTATIIIVDQSVVGNNAKSLPDDFFNDNTMLPGEVKTYKTVTPCDENGNALGAGMTSKYFKVTLYAKGKRYTKKNPSVGVSVTDLSYWDPYYPNKYPKEIEAGKLMNIYGTGMYYISLAEHYMTASNASPPDRNYWIGATITSNSGRLYTIDSSDIEVFDYSNAYKSGDFVLYNNGNATWLYVMVTWDDTANSKYDPTIHTVDLSSGSAGVTGSSPADMSVNGYKRSDRNGNSATVPSKISLWAEVGAIMDGAVVTYAPTEKDTQLVFTDYFGDDYGWVKTLTGAETLKDTNENEISDSSTGVKWLVSADSMCADNAPATVSYVIKLTATTPGESSTGLANAVFTPNNDSSYKNPYYYNNDVKRPDDEIAGKWSPAGSDSVIHIFPDDAEELAQHHGKIKRIIPLTIIIYDATFGCWIDNYEFSFVKAGGQAPDLLSTGNGNSGRFVFEEMLEAGTYTYSEDSPNMYYDVGDISITLSEDPDLGYGPRITAISGLGAEFAYKDSSGTILFVFHIRRDAELTISNKITESAIYTTAHGAPTFLFEVEQLDALGKTVATWADTVTISETDKRNNSVRFTDFRLPLGWKYRVTELDHMRYEVGKITVNGVYYATPAKNSVTIDLTTVANATPTESGVCEINVLFENEMAGDGNYITSSAYKVNKFTYTAPSAP
jgi:hypothetical protein